MHNWKFLWRFIQSPAIIGSIIPSSQRLAREIVKDVPGTEAEGPPRRYLEVGPGTGVFTQHLVKKLRPIDHLDIVEYDPEFVAILKKQFGYLKNVHVVHADFTQFCKEKKYDYCISGLPLAVFSFEMVSKVYDSFQTVIKANGRLAYFEYMGVTPIKRLLLSKKAYRDFDLILSMKTENFIKHNGRAEKVLLNMMPARVCRLVM